MKRHTLVRNVAIVASVAALIVLTIPLASRSPRFAADAAASRKDRLFRKMGVLSIPQTPQALDFTLEDFNGNSVRFVEFRDRIVFLNFWTTWCPECRIEMPSMRKLYEALKHRDFAMVAVDLKESSETVKQFAAKYKLPFPVLIDPDGRMGEQMSIRAVPTTFIIDRQGKVLGSVLGGRKWDSKESFALFEYLIDMQDDAPS